MNHHKAWGISLAQHAHLPPELMQCLTREAACCCQLKFSVGEGETSSLPTYMCSQILPCITAPVVVWAPLQGSQGQVFCWEQPLLTLLLVKDRNFYILLVCHVSKRESKQEKKKKRKENTWEWELSKCSWMWQGICDLNFFSLFSTWGLPSIFQKHTVLEVWFK